MITYHKITAKVKALTHSKKKTFRLATANTIAPQGGWNGGSREYFGLIDYKTLKDLPLIIGDNFSIMPIEQELPLDSILVTTSIFCGKPGVATITCREDQIEEIKAWLGVTDKGENGL